jgi:hypothetical protein
MWEMGVITGTLIIPGISGDISNPPLINISPLSPPHITFLLFFIPPPRGSPHNMNIQHLYCFSTEFQTTPQTLTQVYINFHIYYLNVMVKAVACVKIVILYFLPDPLNWTPSTRYAGGTRYVRVYIYPAVRRAVSRWNI